MPSTAAAGSGEGDGDDVEAQDRRAAAGSLQDHLRAQIVGMRLGDDDRAALEVLLESLDGDGYLADPLEEIAERLADMLGPDREEARDELDARLRCALQWLQSLEPTGVGARTLAECLQLQLRTQPPGPARELAMTLCELHLELLARRDMRRLTALTGADEDLVRQAQALITACEPKPGAPSAAPKRRSWCPTSSCARPDAVFR